MMWFHLLVAGECVWQWVGGGGGECEVEWRKRIENVKKFLKYWEWIFILSKKKIRFPSQHLVRARMYFITWDSPVLKLKIRLAPIPSLLFSAGICSGKRYVNEIGIPSFHRFYMFSCSSHVLRPWLFAGKGLGHRPLERMAEGHCRVSPWFGSCRSFRMEWEGKWLDTESEDPLLLLRRLSSHLSWSLSSYKTEIIMSTLQTWKN